jgi:hypothetical protein
MPGAAAPKPAAVVEPAPVVEAATLAAVANVRTDLRRSGPCTTALASSLLPSN